MTDAHRGGGLSGRLSHRTASAATAVLLVKLAAVGAVGVLVANCGQQQTGRRLSAQESREVGFFSGRQWGTASPRVVQEGEAVPKGGGREHIGRSYTVAGRRYTPYAKPVGYAANGAASWYGAAFHGRKTANGEVYDRHGISAAHPTMPLPSYARVTNMSNRRSIIVRVNDRGPFHPGRIIDVSQKTAELLEFRHIGTARVRVEYIGRAALAGSDDRRLIASLTTDGTPAGVPGMSMPGTMVAEAPAMTPRAVPVRQDIGPVEAPAVAAARPRRCRSRRPPSPSPRRRARSPTRLARPSARSTFRPSPARRRPSPSRATRRAPPSPRSRRSAPRSRPCISRRPPRERRRASARTIRLRRT